MDKKKRNGILAIGGLLALVLIVGTLALFSTSFKADNVFTVGAPGAYFEETFFNPDPNQVLKGGTFDKSGKVVNTGDVPLVARAKIETAWFEANGTTPINNEFIAGEYAATLNFGTTAGPVATDVITGFPWENTAIQGTGNYWVYDESSTIDANNGYFYYNGIIAKAIDANNPTISNPLLASVTINDQLGVTETPAIVKYFPAVENIIGVPGKTLYKMLDGATIYWYEPTQNLYYDSSFVPLDPNAKPTGATFAYVETGEIDKPDNGVPYRYTETSDLLYPQFSGAKLTVTISGEIMQADKDGVTGQWLGIPASVLTSWGW
ncbi:MAG: BsaA family SipW-dependent biofilm matrix protein [Eubacteriaceae bacterium]